MSVLFIGPLPEPVSGQALACQALLDELQKRHVVEVIDLKKRTFVQGVDSLGRVREVLSFAWDALRKNRRASVIYFTISESFAGSLKDNLIYACCYPRLRRMVVHLHGGAGMREIMRGKFPLLASLNRFFLRRVGAIVVLGGRHVDMFAKVSHRNVRIVENFAEDDLFVDREAIDRKFGEHGVLRVLFLSNLIPGKGYLELVEAYRGLPDSMRSQIRIDFAGGFEDDNQKQSFMQLIAPEPGVHYHGTVRGDEKRRVLREAHILCLPTYYPYEGQPISILEGYASGCAVITTDHSGIFDVFEPGINGLAVEKRSAESLRDGIIQAFEAPDEMRRMAFNNLAVAEGRYRVSHFNANLVAVIDEVAAGRVNGASANGRDA